jgi:hypothetical protein
LDISRDVGVKHELRARQAGEEGKYASDDVGIQQGAEDDEGQSDGDSHHDLRSTVPVKPLSPKVEGES